MCECLLDGAVVLESEGNVGVFCMGGGVVITEIDAGALKSRKLLSASSIEPFASQINQVRESQLARQITSTAASHGAQ